VTTPSIYVASPLGFTEPGRRWLSDVLHPAIVARGIGVLDPWADPTGVVGRTLAIPADEPGRLGALQAMNRTLGATNAASIAGSDGVLAILDGTDVDSGTAAEIGYAAARGLPVVGLRTDVRPAGDNAAATVNLQVEYFIEATGGKIYDTLDDALTGVAEAIDDRLLFHLAFRTTWADAAAAGAYTASTRDASLDEVGFIHCSFRRQLGETSRRHYADVDPAELVLLTIDRRRLSSRLVVEHAPSVDDAFPHVYGPINLDAVISADAVIRDPSGMVTTNHR
jgi:uncharacterized protein (DUF952 family)